MTGDIGLSGVNECLSVLNRRVGVKADARIGEPGLSMNDVGGVSVAGTLNSPCIGTGVDPVIYHLKKS